jgi:excisionase family DNA binding protein
MGHEVHAAPARITESKRWSATMQLLKVAEAADKARCSTFTIYRWISCDMLPATKVGKHWWIREDDLDELLNRAPRGLEEYVKAIVDGAPQLTQDQVQQLRDALGRRNA